MLFAVWIASCAYPSIKDGEITTNTQSDCIGGDLKIAPAIFEDLEFDGTELSWFLSGKNHAVYYVAKNGLYKQTHWIDNGPDDFSNGLVRLRINEKYGFMDSLLNTRIEPRWDFAFPFMNGKAKVGDSCNIIPSEEQEHHSSVECKHWNEIDANGNILITKAKYKKPKKK